MIVRPSIGADVTKLGAHDRGWPRWKAVHWRRRCWHGVPRVVRVPRLIIRASSKARSVPTIERVLTLGCMLTHGCREKTRSRGSSSSSSSSSSIVVVIVVVVVDVGIVVVVVVVVVIVVVVMVVVGVVVDSSYPLAITS